MNHIERQLVVDIMSDGISRIINQPALALRDPIPTLHIVDRCVIARRRSCRDDLVRCESVRPSTRQVVHEARDPDEKQEKQEHEVEHQ